MPVLRLRKHQANFSDEDILINPSDFPELKLNDVVELRPPRSSRGEPSLSNESRILLQVRKWPETNQSYTNSVSIKDSVVNTHLKLYSDVIVNIVDKKEVLVDSIEICFSNAYLARSYMWGLRNHLNNRCVYQRQKLDHLNIRTQICEIWAQGKKVSSGYVDDDTKLVFRSASSLVYLFIQMSSEMWDYDINGDLYCEKAINGFLTDLFETWRQNDCSHDITIVLFSRTFYDAERLDEFPEEMRECLQVDYKGRFYEDCYRVAFQNDRFDLHDWSAKLTTLKSLFNQYQKEVINRHQEKYNTKIPRAYNSSAAQGNFLEVLNMSLNVFEKHYFDRSFDRTGQLSVVVSPGVGVFEVDFEMTNLTKQRIIDNGIGSDLVCLGEQPLHTVPLLKFNSKSSQMDDRLATCDVYNMPHWINLSFYSSQNQVYYSNFVPRIKLPTLNTTNSINTANRLKSDSSRANLTSDGASAPRNRIDSSCMMLEDSSGYTNCRQQSNNGNQNGGRSRNNQSSEPQMSSHQHHQSAAIPDLVDYDDYDAQVFKSTSMVAYHQQQRGDRSILADMDPNVDDYLSDSNEDYDFPDRSQRNKSANIQRRSSAVKNYQEYSRNIKRQASENLPIDQSRHQLAAHHQVQSTFTRMSLVDSYITDVKIKPESADDLSVRGYNVQSSRLTRSAARPKALINPFDPSHMTIKLTPNRRRWTHVFPQGPTGTFIQQHHYQPTVQQKGSLPYLADVSPTPPTIYEHESLAAGGKPLARTGNEPVQLHQNLDSASLLARRSPNPNPSNRGNGLSKRHPGGTVLSQQQQQAASIANSISANNKSTLVSNDTIRFAWCASGEQEWTPAITTGVDWKSLTMPACLPLTTDFFPSKTSLQNDYVISEYNIDSSFIHHRYTLIDVYRELVCQRLQKGFQVILLPGQTMTTTTVTGSISGAANHTASSTATATSSNSISGSHKSRHSSSSKSSHQRTSRTSSSSAAALAAVASNGNGGGGSQDIGVERERTEYTLSIGRIFHKLTLTGNTITVTHYRPRHPYPTIKIDYCYRFRAPFHETYGQSWVHFKSEKLENYNWNYLDNYVCARGESTFALRSSLKFWRFRIHILPSKLCLQKLPHASGAGGNKLAAHLESSKSTATLSSSSVGACELPTRHDIFYQTFSNEERDALMESFIKLLEIINKTRRASASRASLSSSSFPSTSSSSKGSSTSSAASAFQSSSSQDSSVASAPYQATSKPTRLAVQIGATNFSNVSGDSSSSDPSSRKQSIECDELHFESINMDIDSALRDARRAEWVHVQHHNFYDIYQAFELIIKWMVASGAGIAEMVQGWSRKVGGSSSVHVVPIPWEPFAMPHSGKADPLRCPLVIKLHLNCLPQYDSLDDNQVISLQEKILRLFGFIRFHDLISSDNIEYQYVHMSGFAFVALPNLISDQEDIPDEDKKQSANSPSSSGVDTQQPILVTNKCAANKLAPLDIKAATKADQRTGNNGRVAKPLGPSFKLVHQETISSPHEEYITRHIGGARQNKAKRLRGENEQIEFIWSWNYMLTKRWRSPATQDESYAVSLMRDFKDFCRNGDDRLVGFWNEIKDSV